MNIIFEQNLGGEVMKKKKYLPPIFNYICTYVLWLVLLIKNQSIILVTGVIWLISLLICYAETIFVIIPHLIKNKRVHIVDKKHWLIEGTLFNAAFIVSYTSEYIYKEKKDCLITNLSTIICLVGYLGVFFSLKNI